MLNSTRSLRRDNPTLGNVKACESDVVLAPCQADIPEECKEDFIDPQVILGDEKRCLTLLAFSIVRLHWMGYQRG